MLERVRLRKIALQAIIDAATLAGPNVYEYDWPTGEQKSPAILFNKDSEVKRSMGRYQPNFTTIATLEFDVRLFANSKEKAHKEIDLLLWQIDQAILTNYYLRKDTQQFIFVNSDGHIDSTTGKHIAHYTVAYGLEFFEDQNQYPAIPAVPLTEIDITVGKSFTDPDAKELVIKLPQT